MKRIVVLVAVLALAGWALWAGPLAAPLSTVLRPLGLWLLEQQRAFQSTLALELRGLATGQTAAIWGLMAACLAYGFLHAAGPGHGKAVLAAWAAARPASARRLAAVGLAAALAQASLAVALALGLAWAAGLSRARIEALDQGTLAPLALALTGALGLWLVWRGIARLMRGLSAGRDGPRPATPRPGHPLRAEGQGRGDLATGAIQQTPSLAVPPVAPASPARRAESTVPAEALSADAGTASTPGGTFTVAARTAAPTWVSATAAVGSHPADVTPAAPPLAAILGAGTLVDTLDLATRGAAPLSSSDAAAVASLRSDTAPAGAAPLKAPGRRAGALSRQTGAVTMAAALPTRGPASAMLAAARGGPAPTAQIYCADPGCADCGRPHLPDAAALARATTPWETAAVIATAAIRPCSGALLVLLLAWQMGILWVGVLGTYAMALGTASVTVTLALAARLGRAGLLRAAAGDTGPRLAAGIEVATGLVLILIAAAVLSALR
jgi:ABC-type nickel/cobalt efflux system permease component RcnA